MFILMKVVNMWWYCSVFLWFIILISSFLQKLIITIIIIFINWLISVSVSLQSTPFPSFSPFDHLLLILHLKNHTISFQSTLLNFPYYSNKNIHDRSKTIRELIHTHPLTFLSLYFTHLDCLTVVILHLHFNCFRLAASDLLSLPAFQPPSKKKSIVNNIFHLIFQFFNQPYASPPPLKNHNRTQYKKLCVLLSTIYYLSHFGDKLNLHRHLPLHTFFNNRWISIPISIAIITSIIQNTSCLFIPYHLRLFILWPLL